jgi:hypothetical protein
MGDVMLLGGAWQFISENQLLSGLIGAAILPASWIAKQGYALARTRRTRVDLHLKRASVDPRLKFGLLHVRDGGEDDPERGPLRNKKCWFRWRTRGVGLTAIVRHRPLLGFQFKCFVDHPNMTFNDVRDALEAYGFLSVTAAAGSPNRAYFLLSGFATTGSPGDIVNNFQFPE